MRATLAPGNSQPQRRVLVTGQEPVAYVQLLFPVVEATHPDYFPLLMLDTVLGGAKSMSFSGGGSPNRSSRLYKALVSTELAASAGCGVRPTSEPFAFTVAATVRRDVDPQQVEDAVWVELQRIATQPLSQAKLNRAHKQTLAQFTYSSESVSSQGYWLGFSEVVADGDWFLRLPTHLAAVKEWAHDRPDVLSAAMEFDESVGRPTFRVRPGATGRSRALLFRDILHRANIDEPVWSGGRREGSASGVCNLGNSTWYLRKDWTRCDFAVRGAFFKRCSDVQAQHRDEANRHRRLQSFKYYLLAFLLALALMGSVQTGLTDPLPLLHRSVNLALLPLADNGLGVLREEPRFVVSAWLIGVVFLGLVGLDLVLPRFFCRFICPLGALFGLLGRFSPWRIGKTADKCGECCICEEYCEGLLASSPLILTVHPSVGVSTPQELLALGKEEPGTVMYGSPGSGSVPHLATELFKFRTRTDFTHVPYKGGGPAVTDLVVGHIGMKCSRARSRCRSTWRRASSSTS